MNEDLVKPFWKQFVTEHPELANEDTPYSDEYFGDDKKTARQFLDLVKSGDKTATCALYRMFEYYEESVPDEGSFHVITTFDGQPEAIIQVTDIDIIPFRAVPEDIAEQESGNTKDFDDWYNEYEAIFTRAMESIGETFEDDLPVVCQQFKLVYKQ
ncbi:uncharacterized protein YhfF [Alkalibacillus flavidus]|uniref:Uncharacterized protein YhfF n=1 Tax=Alkalibacillus flavidus TaxID=546021 RepID=A0ABV2KT50_9BACI